MKQAKAFPTGHVIGFIVSLALTVAAAWVALKTNLSFNMIMLIIGSLAFVQAGLQLFLFMHVNEGEDVKSNMVNLTYGIFTAVVIVLGTMWVMSFGDHMH